MIRIGLQRFRPHVMIAVLLSAAILPNLPARAQTSEQAYVPARITQAINETSLVTLHSNTHPLAQARYDRGPAPLSMPASRLLLVLQRSGAQEAALATYLQSLHDPSSPNYRKWLTPDQFGKLYGVSDADLATIEAWLQGHGFAINKVAKGRMAIEFSGTVAQVQTAFHTSLHSYVVNGEQHWANASDPQIPAALASVVAGLAELNNFVPKPQSIRAPSGVYNPESGRIEPTYTVGSATNGYTIFLGPADAATIYDTPTTYNANHSGTTYDGTGIKIGIAGDSNIDITQNANYRATFGLPANATQVVVDGTDPGENGDAIEAYLDTQVAGGIAPGATVTLYTAADTYYDAGLFLAIGRAIDENDVDILNVSFGGCESAQGSAGNQFINSLWQQAAAQGISVTVSTGDSGSAGCDNPNSETVAKYGLAVNGLASTPYNIAVGGTDFDTLYGDGSNFPASFTAYVNVSNSLANHRSALKYIPEEPWNDATFQGDNTTISQNVPWTATNYASNANIVGGGGGVSDCAQITSGVCTAGYALPTWQSGFATDNSGRNLPDVSLLAGNGLYGATWGLCTDLDADSNGNAIVDCAGTPTTGNNFNLTGVGGTSASAPAFAAILALVAQKAGGRLGQADYELYKLAKSKYSTVFHDIAIGNNSVPCTPGSTNCARNSSGYYFLTGYDTKTGYDEATGLGSVDATQLVNNWSSAAGTATSSSLTLNGGTSALTLTHGASVTVNANVTGSGGTPTGNLALVDNIDPATLPNNDSIGSFALSGGTASGATTYLPGGSYKVSAHYGGDSTFAQSDSNAIPVTVGAESSSTDLKVREYFDPSTGNAATTPYYGYIYLIDAQPYGQSASASVPNGAATGTITFKSGSTAFGTATIASDGIAELQTALLPGGANALTAAFPGDASFLANTSSVVNFTVTPAITTLATPTVQPASSVVAGSSLTFAVVLSVDSIGAAPTGTVAFKNGTTAIGAVPMVGTAGTSAAYASGQASFSTTTLAAGTYSITAVYSGDGNYAGSTSSPVSVTVTAASAPGLALAGTAVTVVAGATTGNTSTITVTPSGGFTGSVALTAAITSSPAGASSAPTLSFGSTTPVSISGTAAGTAALTITTTATTTPGSYTVAVTGTSGTLTASSSILVTVTASTSIPGLTLKGTALTVVAGGSTGNTSTLTVTPSGGFTGSVALNAVLTSSPAGAVNAPTLSFGATTPVSISGTTAGTATLTVTTKAATTTALAKPPQSPWLPAGGLALAGLLLLISPSQRRRWRTMLGVLVFLAALTSGLLACGGGSTPSGGGGTTTPGTTAGAYTITVTGTSGTLTATTTVSLTVD